MSDPATRIETYEDFVKVHGVLFAASGFPRSLHRKLFEKLTAETFDGGAYFQAEPCEDGRHRRLILAAESMPKHSHMSSWSTTDYTWTFRLSDAYKQLKEEPGLAERMAALMCVDIDYNSNGEGTDENPKLSAEEVVESEIQNAKEKGEGDCLVVGA